MSRVLVLLLLAPVVASYTDDTGKFSLVNRGGENIRHATVAICGQASTFGPIPSDKSVSGSYTVKGDCHYTVELEFESGKQLHSDVGYVTSGLKVQDELQVTPSGVTINSERTKTAY